MSESTGGNRSIFQSVFGKQWDQLPKVFKKHYDIRPYTEDKTTVQGNVDVKCNRFLKLFHPFYRYFGNIPAVTQSSVPVTVNFQSSMDSDAFHFNRVFKFSNEPTYEFNSRMFHLGENLVVEEMKFGFCWKTRFEYKDRSVILRHQAYAVKIANYYLHLPLELLIGKGDAVEQEVDDDHFKMKLEITHPIFGLVYSYGGVFKVASQE